MKTFNTQNRNANETSLHKRITSLLAIGILMSALLTACSLRQKPIQKQETLLTEETELSTNQATEPPTEKVSLQETSTTTTTKKQVPQERKKLPATKNQQKKENSVAKSTEKRTEETEFVRWGKKEDLDPIAFAKKANAYAAIFDNVVIDESLEVGSSSWSFNECSGAYKNEDELFENIKGCIECEIEQARASGYFGEGSPLHFNLKVQLEYNKNYGDYYYTCYTLYLA